MEKTCKKYCLTCLQSYNPVYCLAPHLNVYAYEPVTPEGLARIKATIVDRLTNSPSWYNYPGLREKDEEYLEKIKKVELLWLA